MEYFKFGVRQSLVILKYLEKKLTSGAILHCSDYDSNEISFGVINLI